jgi:hypothetical protein
MYVPIARLLAYANECFATSLHHTLRQYFTAPTAIIDVSLLEKRLHRGKDASATQITALSFPPGTTTITNAPATPAVAHAAMEKR